MLILMLMLQFNYSNAVLAFTFTFTDSIDRIHCCRIRPASHCNSIMKIKSCPRYNRRFNRNLLCMKNSINVDDDDDGVDGVDDDDIVTLDVIVDGDAKDLNVIDPINDDTNENDDGNDMPKSTPLKLLSNLLPFINDNASTIKNFTDESSPFLATNQPDKSNTTTTSTATAIRNQNKTYSMAMRSNSMSKSKAKPQANTKSKLRGPILECRIAATADGKILSRQQKELNVIQDKIDSIYNAINNQNLKQLHRLEQHVGDDVVVGDGIVVGNNVGDGDGIVGGSSSSTRPSSTRPSIRPSTTRPLASTRTLSSSPPPTRPSHPITTTTTTKITQEMQQRHNATTIQTLRQSLENSGFKLLSQRDLDLCKALNEGYLLRLSIAPELKNLDNLYSEFYGDGDYGDYGDDTTLQELLFDGKILIFRRGYSQEITTGRLLLPKFDYLQSSLVQRSAATIVKRLAEIERGITLSITTTYQQIQSLLESKLDGLRDQIPDEFSLDDINWNDDIDGIDDYDNDNRNNNGTFYSLKGFNRNGAFNVSMKVKEPLEKGVDMLKNASIATGTSLNKTKISIKLERYGYNRDERFVDSPDNTDALSPFLVCEDNGIGIVDNQDRNVEQDLLKGVESGSLSCKYDMRMASTIASIDPPIHLLNRVSIANLVDFFSKGGRRRLIKSLFSVSELVEPTYEEVVLVYRPLPCKQKPPPRIWMPPKFLFDILEIFALEHMLPQPPEPILDPDPLPLEIRTFDGVPMANLLAVLPKTKLIFRPADALIFDLVNTFSFLAVLASQKFDSPKLDLLALGAVSIWLLRTFFRYSNKIARYDLLVNKFLTSRISHRNSGALKYIASEAAVQRARRASLVHEWLVDEHVYVDDHVLGERPTQRCRNDIVSEGLSKVNARLDLVQPLFFDIDAAVDDLLKLGLIRFNDKAQLVEVKEGDDAVMALATLWNDIL